MKTKFNFNIGNRGLLEEELGLAERVNARLRASAEKHRMDLKPDVFVAVKRVSMGNGKVMRRVSSMDKDPVEVPVATA